MPEFTDSFTVQQKLSLKISSNEMPDITTSVLFPVDYRKYAASGVLYDMTDKINPTDSPNLYNALPEEYWDMAKINGKIYGIPFIYGLGEGYRFALTMRIDILKELGLEEPKTLEDYYNACKKVKEVYPDMIPLVLEPTFRLDVFKAWLIPGWTPITSGMMETEEGTIIHHTSMPEYETFLRYINSLYREGYIAADTFAFTDGSQAEELAFNNKAFAYTFCTGDSNSGFTLQTRANGTEDALWVQSMPLTDASYSTVGTGWSGTFITRNNKDPEKSIKLLEFLFSEEGQRLSQWGREGIEYTLDEGGIPTFSEEWIAARDDEQLFYQKYNPAYYFGISQVTEAVGRAAGTSENASQLMDIIRSRLKLSVLPALVEPKGDSDERMMLDQVIEHMRTQEVKIVLSNSDEEFEQNLAEMRTTLERIGVAALEAYMTAETANYK